VRFSSTSAVRASLGSVLVALAVLRVSIYRAATQSITHDEARVFPLYRVRLHVLYEDPRTGTLVASTSGVRASVVPEDRRSDDPSGRFAASAPDGRVLRAHAR